MSENSKIKKKVVTKRKEKGTLKKIALTVCSLTSAIFAIEKGLNNNGQNKEV